jgi:hypothetical protein
MYRQAVERAWSETNERTRPASQFVRLACKPIAAGSKEILTVHKRSDPIFTPRAQDKNAAARRYSGSLQAGFVQESDERGISRGAGRVYAEGTHARVVITKTNSRSVLGSMNDLAFQVKSIIHMSGGLTDADLSEITQQLNRIPMSAIKYRFSIDELKRRLADTHE